MSTKFNLQEYLQELRTPEHIEEMRAHVLAGTYMVQIEQAMEQQGLNNKQLAEKVDVNPSYISKLFHSEKMLSFKMLVRIEQALGIDFLEQQPPIETEEAIAMTTYTSQTEKYSLPTGCQRLNVAA